jgi:hypothetical protein
MHTEVEWQHYLALGSIASRLQQPGWQAVTLEQYACACYTSRAGSEGPFSQPAKLLPLVKLHGTRLKLLACLMGPAAAGAGIGGLQAAAAAAAAAGGSQGVLDRLLRELDLLSKWCWNTAAGDRLRQDLLPELRQQLQIDAAACGRLEQQQEQQQKLVKLRNDLQKHWQWDDADHAPGKCTPGAGAMASDGLGGSQRTDGSGATPRRSGRGGLDVAKWQEAVTMLVDDCIAALSFCNSCCVRPLGPACYSLAKGLFLLGR